MTARPPRPRFRGLILLVLVAVCVLHAQESAVSPTTPAVSTDQSTSAPPEPSTLRTNYVESGGSYMDLSNGYGYWADGYGRGAWNVKNNTWNAEVTGRHEFGDAGVYFATGDTHTFDPNWYASLTLGSSAGGFFWPRLRTDAFLNRKWLGSKRWITTIGYSYYAAKDVHRDHSFYLGSTYYFEKPWILEVGTYFNLSNPGTVFAPAGFLAATHGRNKHYYVVVRAGFAEEAYQLIGPTTTLTDFNSQTLTITWRKWAGQNWGFNFVGDYYHSPFYTRGGSSFGLFKDF